MFLSAWFVYGLTQGQQLLPFRLPFFLISHPLRLLVYVRCILHFHTGFLSVYNAFQYLCFIGKRRGIFKDCCFLGGNVEESMRFPGIVVSVAFSLSMANYAEEVSPRALLYTCFLGHSICRRTKRASTCEGVRVWVVSTATQLVYYV